MKSNHFFVLRPVFLAVFALTLGACRTTSGTNASLADTIDSRGKDVTVTQAGLWKRVGLKFQNYFVGDLALNADNCNEVSRRGHQGSDGRTYYYVGVDCSKAVENVARLEGSEKPSPLINKANYEYVDIPDSHDRYGNTGACELVEINTVTPDDVLSQASFKGIGFYFGRSSSSSIVIPLRSLHMVGSVKLKDGKPATVHRFIAVGMCFGNGGNGGSSADRQYFFRPYAQFSKDGHDYNVWDNVEKDYLLGRDRTIFDRYVFIPGFDRRSELLSN